MRGRRRGWTVDAQAVLLADLVSQMGRSGPVVREPVRVWAMSGVERIGFGDGSSLVFKWAVPPFTGEADVLRALHGQGLPVPEVFASTVRDGVLGMLMEDRGPALGEADEATAATAAVRVHSAQMVEGLPVLDRGALAGLPARMLASLAQLRSAGRWTQDGGIDAAVRACAAQADRLSDGAELAPFGLCHSEFHPTSVHVGGDGWRLLDWARAFTGPGLLDLASWQGTQEPPDWKALRRLITEYVEAGGAPEVTRPRGGLLVEDWALGWHRLWAVAWYLEQAAVWMPNPDNDAFAMSVVRRHLAEACTLLRVQVA